MQLHLPDLSSMVCVRGTQNIMFLTMTVFWFIRGYPPPLIQKWLCTLIIYGHICTFKMSISKYFKNRVRLYLNKFASNITPLVQLLYWLVFLYIRNIKKVPIFYLSLDVNLAPIELQISRLTATSATFSWMPSNSNFEHIVSVNGIDTKIAKPAIYKVHLSGKV